MLSNMKQLHPLLPTYGLSERKNRILGKMINYMLKIYRFCKQFFGEELLIRCYVQNRITSCCDSYKSLWVVEKDKSKLRKYDNVEFVTHYRTPHLKQYNLGPEIWRVYSLDMLRTTRLTGIGKRIRCHCNP